MPVYLQCVIMAVAIPVVISLYAMVRRPEWSGDTSTPWWMINALAMCGGMASAVAAIDIMTRRGLNDRMTLLYLTGVMAILGWLTVSCSITDFQVRKIDRHMLRPIYSIQAIVSALYMYATIKSLKIFIIFLVMMIVLMIIIIVTGYIRPLKFGTSDARCYACMFALCIPALRLTVLWPFAFSIIAIIATGIVIFTIERNREDVTVSYDGKGVPSVRAVKSKAKAKSRVNGMEIHTPAGHAITIPFLVTMFIWLSIA